RGIHSGELLQGVHSSLDEEGHEAQLHAMFLGELVLELLAQLHHGSHVHFIERGQDGVGGLRLQQTLGDTSTQTCHGHALLGTITQVCSSHRSRHLRQSRLGSTSGDSCTSLDCAQSIALGHAAILACTSHVGGGQVVIGQDLGSSR